MKAAVFLGNGKVDIREIPKPKPQRGELLIKVGLCGICGTDAHIFSGDLQIARPPVVLGHEVSGDIITMGRDVVGFEVGQRISIDPVVTCGQCEYCHTGRTNLCRKQSVIGYVRNGGFAQYMVVPASHVYSLNEETDYKTGILVETFACVIHGFERLDFKAGHSAMVLGAGTVGLLWNQILLKSPITNLLQTELVPYRRKKARKLGADHIFIGEEPDLKEKIIAICPEGVDYIIDATGDPGAVEQAIPWIRKGGTFLIFGVCPEDAKIQLSPYAIYEREIWIKSSMDLRCFLGVKTQLLRLPLIHGLKWTN